MTADVAGSENPVADDVDNLLNIVAQHNIDVLQPKRKKRRRKTSSVTGPFQTTTNRSIRPQTNFPESTASIHGVPASMENVLDSTRNMERATGCRKRCLSPDGARHARLVREKGSCMLCRNAKRKVRESW